MMKMLCCVKLEKDVKDTDTLLNQEVEPATRPPSTIFTADQCDGTKVLIIGDDKASSFPTMVKEIYSGNSYKICFDSVNQNVWMKGLNAYGACCFDEKGRWTTGYSEFVHPTLSEWTPMTFFKEKCIILRKICVSVSGQCTFFITDNNILYGAGYNENGALGVVTEKCSINRMMENQYLPVRIDDMENVIDIQPASAYCIALCGSNDQHSKRIISFWASSVAVPDVIFKMILAYKGK